jgi:predicted transposase YbfD/YdcC
VVGDFLKRSQGADAQVSIDGKSLRGTIANGQTRGVYLLAVYAPQAGIVLRQVEIGSQANELTAAPGLLAAIDLAGRVVTGDALFTQRELSAQLVQAQAHYLWKVKDNQPTLRADLERLFAPESCLPGHSALHTDFQSVTDHRKRHGRLEHYTLTCSALLNVTTDWPALAQVFQLVRHVSRTGHTTCDVSYGITSLSAQQAPPQRLLRLVRSHWAIENCLHYCRDVVFREDRCRLRIGHAARTIAILNNLVLGLLRLRRFPSPTNARRRFAACLSEALALVLYAFA